MNLSQLSPIHGRSAKRVGRGIAAGQGKTAGRGTKGQKSRSGHNIPTGFEGGQTKLYMRLPKLRGSRSIDRGRASVTFSQLDASYKDKERVTFSSLQAHGLVSKHAKSVKVIARGELFKQLKFSGVSFSAAAYKKLYGSTAADTRASKKLRAAKK